MTDRILARLVYDGSGPPVASPEMGVPRADQLQGTPLEQLCELAGRVCYDSLGSGKNSADYHRHVQEVHHLSILEHANFTVSFPWTEEFVPFCLLNRPGLWVERSMVSLRLTANLRTVLEWDDWINGSIDRWHQAFGAILRDAAHDLAPQIVTKPDDDLVVGATKLLTHDTRMALVTSPRSGEEAWITLYLRGSRGMSHEQVRHGDRTAISQRSTRYCDESESPWVEHPLVSKRKAESDVDPSFYDDMADDVVATCREAYYQVASLLHVWLETKGVDKLSARKQARGAARGYLGNALETELIFSASVAQWRRMVYLRCSNAADAEIRVLYGQVVRELKRSALSRHFDDLELEPSADGIGEVVKGGGLH